LLDAATRAFVVLVGRLIASDVDSRPTNPRDAPRRMLLEFGPDA